jgi:ankyrin repeat protein
MHATNSLPTKNKARKTLESENSRLIADKLASEKKLVTKIKQAIIEGDKQSLESYLYKYCKSKPINTISTKEGNLLNFAASNSSLEIFSYLYENFTDLYVSSGRNFKTPLHVALECKKLEIAGYLLVNAQELINIKDKYGYTPLIEAAATLNDSVPNLEKYEFKQFIKQLLEKGANPNEIDIEGNTALHKCHDIGFIRLLTEYKADITICNNKMEPTFYRSIKVLNNFKKEVDRRIDNLKKSYCDLGGLDQEALEEYLSKMLLDKNSEIYNSTKQSLECFIENGAPISLNPLSYKSKASEFNFNEALDDSIPGSLYVYED